MKIAICIAGHLRTMSIFGLLDILENRGISYDVYASSWNTTGKWLEPTKLPYNDPIDRDNARLGIYEHERREIDTGFFPSIKNIARYEVEDDMVLIPEIVDLADKYSEIIEPGQFDPEREHQRKYQIFSMFRKCQRSIQMIENPEEYDLILRTRFDATFDMNRVVDCIDFIIKNKKILIPSNFEFGGEYAEGGGRICDSFALGTPEDMVKYSRIYEFLRKDDTIEFLKKNNIWFCPHSLLRQHLLLEGVSYHRENIQYDLVRGEKIFYERYKSIWDENDLKNKNMRLDFIEIGTADFNTIIQECGDDVYGISIEPIKKYIDKLPSKPNVKKINAALVDDPKIKSTTVFFVDEEIIDQHGLGHWLKGCNSVGKPHDFHLGHYPDPGVWHRTHDRESLPKRNLLEEGLVTSLEVPCLTFEDLMTQNSIEYVDYIKIDTEGQDSKLVHSILDFYEKTGKELPNKILFESNAHNDPNEVNSACKRLSEFGYQMDGWNGNSYDTINLHDCLAIKKKLN